jgi:hypothetical protein
MANKVVHSKRLLMLGLGPGAARLKEGVNLVDESLIDTTKWYIQALISSGDIVIEDTPEEPDPDSLAEVVIQADKIEVIPEKTVEAVPEKVPEKKFTSKKPKIKREA